MPSKVYEALYRLEQLAENTTFPDTVQIPTALMRQFFLAWETGTLAQSIEAVDEIKSWLAYYLDVDVNERSALNHSAQVYPGRQQPRQPSPRDIWDRLPAAEKQRISQIVFERDEWVCLHCGTPENLTVDHIIPLSRGGTNDFGNLQTLCKPCNSRKKNKMPIEASNE
jgi:hypothetical protein